MPDKSTLSTHPTIYRTYTPRKPLADFVETFWLYENYNPSHAKERRLPDGSMELVINLREDTYLSMTRISQIHCAALEGALSAARIQNMLSSIQPRNHR